jgi:hypothetical protein
VLLGTTSSAPATVLEPLLIAAGLNMLITGVTGHCRHYQKLGHVPKSLRTTR